ncbi:glycoside hydrolase family 105 protein [Xylariomycetidae sp. FL0641]|nr:glycoside hydrolase family 105 protein [Xylariomycetidae sp. FL0641]
MKSSLLFAAGATASTPYLTWMADSFMERGVEATFDYDRAVLYLGFEAAYALTKNESYAEWYRGQIDGPVVKDDGTIADWDYDFYSLDEYRIGNSFLWWYERTGDDKYKTAMDIIRDQLNRHPRNDEGGFWHRDPTYPDQMWLDGIFMADTFYARYTAAFDNDNTTAWDDIALQYDLIEKHCRNQTTGLLVHGYDGSKQAVWADPDTGAAPIVWDRALGWYFITLLEVIPVWPKSHEAYSRLVEYFTTLAAAVKKAQDESGGWWLVMSDPYVGAEGNYIESSGSAMFTYGWLKGMDLGLLPEDEYLDVAKKAHSLLVDKFVSVDSDTGLLDWEGTVEVGSLSSNGTFEYYISVPTKVNDYKGAGPFMIGEYEIETKYST